MVGEKYIAAMRDAVGALPLLVPVLEEPIDPGEILSAVDGLLFTGSYSNVAPHRYSGARPREGVLQDERRDATALPLLLAAIDRGIPVLCICRGFQELNVALGGALHQHVEEVPGRIDHRESPDASIDQQYGPAHDVVISEGGVLAKLSRERTVKVNSLHSQGIDLLAPSLFVEARAPDQTIEAVSLPSSKSFLLGVQWHPEWNWVNDPMSKALFFAFRDAVRESASASR